MCVLRCHYSFIANKSYNFSLSVILRFCTLKEVITIRIPQNNYLPVLLFIVYFSNGNRFQKCYNETLMVDIIIESEG